MAKIKHTDDARTENTLRHKYRVLSDDEKRLMDEVKDAGQALIDRIRIVRSLKAVGDQNGGAGRECAIATTKTEEAVMWAVKGLTK